MFTRYCFGIVFSVFFSLGNGLKTDRQCGLYHGLLHWDDLLTVDLLQSPDMAFQSVLQRASGLKHTGMY